MSRTRVLATAAAVFTLLALLFSTQIVVDARYSGHPVTWGQALILAFAGWFGWAVLAPLIVILARREPFTRPGILVHALASLLLTLIKFGATMQLLAAAGFGRRESQWAVNLPLNIATYWAIVVVVRAVDAHLRARRLETSLAEARLELLLSQIRPHFLFNTLHAISELMHEDVDAADRMVTRLSELLRASIETRGRTMIPLRQELGIVERYVDIARMRFDGRPQLRVDAEPETLDLLVPTFLLQPLVENAVHHGKGSVVEVRASAGSELLRIVVRDDGEGFGAGRDGENERPRAAPPPGLLPHGRGDSGIGLANVRERVELLGGLVETRDDHGAVVEILLPRRSA